MFAVVEFVVLGLVFWAFGIRLADWWGLRSDSAAERFGLAVVLSYGAVTLALFGLAVARAVSLASVLGIAVVMLVVSLKPLRKNLSQLASAVRAGGYGKEWLPPKAGLEGWVLLLTAAFYLLGLLVALAPPTGIDAGVYHFTIPKVILQERGLVPRDDIWMHKSGGFYMLYVFGMALGGEILAKLLGYGASLMGAVLAHVTAERLRPGTGRLAAFIVASTPLSAGFTGYENLELPIVMYLLAATLALVRYREGGGKRWVVVACGLAGLAFSAKPSAFPAVVLVPFGLILLWARERRRAGPAFLGGLGIFLLSGGFWLVWNYATTGVFVYRYPGSALDEVPAPSPSAGYLISGVARTLGFIATMGVYWTESAGPFIIAGVAGFVVFLWRTERRLPLLLLGLSVLAYVGILLVLSPGHLWTGSTGRYLAPALVSFGALTAAAFAGWAREARGFFRLAVTAALLFPAGPLLVLKGGKAAVATPAALGLESRSAYLSKKIETFAACEWLNRLPDPGVRVLFMAFRPYYLDRPFVHAVQGGLSPFFQGLLGREDFVRRAREQRITHVLYEPSGVQAPWLADPGAFFGAPPFHEVGRWPYWGGKWVRLYELVKE